MFPKLFGPRPSYSAYTKVNLRVITALLISGFTGPGWALDAPANLTRATVLGRASVTEHKDWYGDDCREQVSREQAAEDALHGLSNRIRARLRAAGKTDENDRDINRSSVVVRLRGLTSSRIGIGTCWLSPIRLLQDGGIICS